MSEALRSARGARLGGDALAPRAIAEHVRRTGGADRAAVAALVRRALSGDPAATSALFGGVVEPLCDAFTARGARACEVVLAQAIELARRGPSGGALHRALAEDGIADEAALRARARWGVRLRWPARLPAPRRVIVLSRITLGADLAVNGVLLPSLGARFPDAETVFVGPEIARPFAEAHGARLVAVDYGRRGGLADRLDAWIPLREAIRAETAGLPPHGWLLVDPDTRLTQLGLLAPAPEAAYRRLPSREAPGSGTLGEIARDWLGGVLGAPCPRPAPMPLRPEDAAWSRRLRAALAGDRRRVVAAGFGTGGNPAKRVGPRFEVEMIRSLLARGDRVLLSRGVDASERAAARELCAAVEASGARVAHWPDGRSLGATADVVTWAADSGAFLAAVAASDAHLGYDSAGQHVAAALGVPTLSAFVAAGGARHARRWAPSGPGPVRVVRVRPGLPEAMTLHLCRAAMGDLPSPMRGR